MPQDQDDIKGADAMKQAPTPGPLSANWTPAKGQNPFPRGDNTPIRVRREGKEWDTTASTFNWDLWVDWKLPALTAPVEASGSEREAWTDLSCDEQMELATRIAANVGYVLTPEPDHPDCPHNRPQPSGETREAVARIVDPSAWRRKDEGHPDGENFVKKSLRLADRILALLSARPLALGGQHSGGEVEKWIKRALIYIEQCVQAGEIHFPGVEEYPADLAGQGFALFGLEEDCDPAAIPNAKLLSTTPARAEALDEGAAGERDDHRYAVVSANFSRPFMAGAYPTFERAQLAQCGSPEKWLIYQRCAAHPSPTPAAPRKVSAAHATGDAIEQMTGLTVADALDDPVSSVEIMRALTTSRTLCVWADGTYRVAPTLDVPIARAEEGALVAVIPMAEIGEVATLAADADRVLGNLLAVIHGDGGHRQIEVGFKQASVEAEDIVVGLFAKTAALKTEAK